MPRARMIKPEFWLDEGLAQLPHSARLLYIGLWNFADDNGNIEAGERRIKAQVFPYEDTPLADVQEALRALAGGGWLQPYTVDGHDFYHIPNFPKHQVINHPSKFGCPLPPQPSGTTTVALPEHSRTTPVPLRPKTTEQQRNQKISRKQQQHEGGVGETQPPPPPRVVVVSDLSEGNGGTGDGAAPPGVDMELVIALTNRRVDPLKAEALALAKPAKCREALEALDDRILRGKPPDNAAGYLVRFVENDWIKGTNGNGAHSGEPEHSGPYLWIDGYGKKRWDDPPGANAAAVPGPISISHGEWRQKHRDGGVASTEQPDAGNTTP